MATTMCSARASFLQHERPARRGRQPVSVRASITRRDLLAATAAVPLVLPGGAPLQPPPDPPCLPQLWQVAVA